MGAARQRFPSYFSLRTVSLAPPAYTAAKEADRMGASKCSQRRQEAFDGSGSPQLSHTGGSG
jgi:hypothetical protein